MSISRGITVLSRRTGLSVLDPTRPVGGNVMGLPSRGVRTNSHPLVGADPDRIQRMLLESELGNMGEIMDLYEDMRERDGRLDAVARTRVLALTGKDYTVKPPRGYEDDPEARLVADHVSDVIAGIEEWETIIAHLMDGALRHYSVVEIEWGQNDKAWWVPVALHWRHPNRFNLSADMRLAKYDQGIDKWPGTPLTDYGPDKFIVHSPVAGRSAYPTRRGALRSCVFPALTKRYGWRWWLTAAERFGQPMPVIKVPPGNEDLYDQAVEMLRAMTADWQAVLTNQMSLEVVPGSGNFRGELHQMLIDFTNTEMAITVLGQNLSTEVQGGSFAAAQAHNFVRFDYLAADAKELEATIRRDLIAALVKYNWPGAPVPRIEFQLIADEQRNVEPWHFSAGIVSANEVREHLGKPALEEASEELAEVAVDPSTALNGAQIQALLTIVGEVAAGRIPRGTGVAMMVTAFPINVEQAESIMGEVGQGFVPVPADLPGALPGGAPGGAGIGAPLALPEPQGAPSAPQPGSADGSLGRSAYDAPLALPGGTASTSRRRSTNPLVRVLSGTSEG